MFRSRARSAQERPHCCGVWGRVIVGPSCRQRSSLAGPWPVFRLLVPGAAAAPSAPRCDADGSRRISLEASSAAVFGTPALGVSRPLTSRHARSVSVTLLGSPPRLRSTQLLRLATRVVFRFERLSRSRQSGALLCYTVRQAPSLHWGAGAIRGDSGRFSAGLGRHPAARPLAPPAPGSPPPLLCCLPVARVRNLPFPLPPSVGGQAPRRLCRCLRGSARDTASRGARTSSLLLRSLVPFSHG